MNATLASALNKKIGKLQHELEQTQYKLASARNLVSSLEKRLETLQDRIMLLEMEMEG